MNQTKSFIFAVMLSLFAIVACGSSDNSTEKPVETVSVSLSPEAIQTSAAGGSYSVAVTTSAKEWTAFAYDDCSSWVKVSTDTKAGTIAITISANKDAARTGTVFFKSGQTRKSITITQYAPLAASKDNVFFGISGGNESVTISGGSNWNATASDSWITCEKQGNETLNISAKANDGDARTGTVTVSTADEKITITVKQDANSDITCPIEGYHLVWNDEFGEGTELNASNWTHEVQKDHWVNNELQNYVNHKSPEGNLVTEIKEGHLQIHCFKENGKVYSGRVYGNKSKGWKYGYVEASIKLPSGKGTWPAFWMMPVNFKSWPHDGEIDIMEEVGYHKDYVVSSLHADGHVHTNNTQVTKDVYCKGAEGEFHTYGMEWTADYFQFYVDGKKTLYYKNPGTGVTDWPYDAPFYVIFNLAWGGDWGGSQGVNESALPITMEVDYVRVFQK